MKKYCTNCGSELPENMKFCPNCGKQIDEENNTNNMTTNNSNNSHPNIQRREIAIAIILSIVTCGIYSIYWFITMTDESNKLSDENQTSGGMAFLFTLLTCGIYALYWYYKMGKKMYEAGIKYNKQISDNAIIYLILSIFGFGIVSYCLIQNDLNKFANE